jgi:hypothetical protein
MKSRLFSRGCDPAQFAHAEVAGGLEKSDHLALLECLQVNLAIETGTPVGYHSQTVRSILSSKQQAQIY